MVETSRMWRSCALSTNESTMSSTAAMSVPMTMNGVRRPRRLVQRSLIAPNSGSRNSARMLSSAIITPDHA